MAVMPVGSQPHRSRIPEVSIPFTVAVARKVKRADVERVPAAKDAVDAEWKKLAEMPHPDGKGVGVLGHFIGSKKERCYPQISDKSEKWH